MKFQFWNDFVIRLFSKKIILLQGILIQKRQHFDSVFASNINVFFLSFNQDFLQISCVKRYGTTQTNTIPNEPATSILFFFISNKKNKWIELFFANWNKKIEKLYFRCVLITFYLPKIRMKVTVIYGIRWCW